MAVATTVAIGYAMLKRRQGCSERMDRGCLHLMVRCLQVAVVGDGNVLLLALFGKSGDHRVQQNGGFCAK